MYSLNIRNSKLESYNYKIFLVFSAITLGIFFPADFIKAQPLINPKFNEINKYSNNSFITEAVERTGPSVVTIETKKYVKKRTLSRNSKLYFEAHLF